MSEPAAPRPQRRPTRLQAQLAVSQPGDPAEREATQTARAVVQALRPGGGQAALRPGAMPQPGQPGAPTRLFRLAKEAPSPQAPTAPKEKPSAAGQPATASPAQPAPTAVEQRVSERQAAATGQPLPEPLRLQMQAQLGADFSAVRLHTDAEAAALCQRMNARAFTVGHDVYFADGAWAPDSPAGLELLAHELTHVVQQGATTGPPQAAALQRDGFWDWLSGEPDAPSDPLAPQRARLAKAELWASGGPVPASPQSMVGAAGIGGLDAQYVPEPGTGHGELRIRQGVAVVFENTLVESGGTLVPNARLPAGNGELARAATRIQRLRPAQRTAVLANFQWAPAERAPWIERARGVVEGAWSGRHAFFLNKPQWNWLGAEVNVTVDIGDRARAAADHTEMHTYKLPDGVSLNDAGIVNELLNTDSPTDAFDQELRVGSTTVAPNAGDLLRGSVYFPRGRSTLSSDAQRELDDWVVRYNGAPDHVAHQDVPIELIGHSSASGTYDGNRQLAQDRVDAVLQYLASHGFTRAASRITTEARGDDEADFLRPTLATDQRVDIIVDHGPRQTVLAHEFGHALGLGDEYGSAATPTAPATAGTLAAHDAWVRAMTRADGSHLPGAVRERNGGMMASGNDVRPQHYAVFHHALETITGHTPWSLGVTVPKWRVQLECGVPARLDDRPPEAPTDPLGNVPVAV